jgi:SNF2 family DNA or RNA helicase
MDLFAGPLSYEDNEPEFDDVFQQDDNNPPLENTLENTLSVFPLASEGRSSYVSNSDNTISKKRKVQDIFEEDGEDFDKKEEIFGNLLFPNEDLQLSQTIGRVEISNPFKKRKINSPESDFIKLMGMRLQEMKTKNKPVFTAGSRVFAEKKIKKPKSFPKIHFDSKFVTVERPPEPPKTFLFVAPNEFGVKMVQPYKLFPYQSAIVRWMKIRENRQEINPHFDPLKSGFLLAAVMGLGKTISIATLIASTISEQRRSNSCTLYCCPKNLLGTVRYEFHKFFGDQLRVIVFHRDFLKSQYDRFDAECIRKYDVIITNYASVVARARTAGVEIDSKQKLSKLKKKQGDVMMVDEEEEEEEVEEDEEEKDKQMINEYNYAPSSSLFSLSSSSSSSSFQGENNGTAMTIDDDNKSILKKQSPLEKKQVAFSFFNFPWFRIVLDESHEIRSKNTSRFRAINKLNSPLRICLTGTPIFNSIKDIFTQLEFCGLALKRGEQQTKKNLIGFGLMNFIKFVEYKDAIDVSLPQKTINKVYFDLSVEERYLHTFYMRRAQITFKELNSTEGRVKCKKTMETQTAILRLMQVCSAPFIITPGAKQHSNNEDMAMVNSECLFPTDLKIDEWIKQRESYAGIMASKMNAFVELVDNIHRNNGGKIVIFANFTSTLNLARDALSRKNNDYSQKNVFVHGQILSSKLREDMFSSFRTDENISMLFMTLKLGSVGLNLTEANNVIFIEPWFSYSALSQGVGRVHRIGQIRPVNIYYLLARDSIEERVFAIAMDKKKLASEVSSEQNDSQKMKSSDMEKILGKY